MAGMVHIPWYATGFRAEYMAAELTEITAVAAHYGSTEYHLHRSRDDLYKMLQMVWFDDKLDWQRYWDGPEFIDFRARNVGRYQVPVLYVWHDVLLSERREILNGAEQAAEPEPQPAQQSRP